MDREGAGPCLELCAADGTRMSMSVAAARKNGTLRGLLEECAPEPGEAVHLPEVRSRELKRVVRFCTNGRLQDGHAFSSGEWTALLTAAMYLDNRELLDAAAVAIASEYLRGRTPAQMRFALGRQSPLAELPDAAIVEIANKLDEIGDVQSLFESGCVDAGVVKSGFVVYEWLKQRYTPHQVLLLAVANAPKPKRVLGCLWTVHDEQHVMQPAVACLAARHLPPARCTLDLVTTCRAMACAIGGEKPRPDVLRELAASRCFNDASADYTDSLEQQLVADVGRAIEGAKNGAVPLVLKCCLESFAFPVHGLAWAADGLLCCATMSGKVASALLLLELGAHAGCFERAPLKNVSSCDDQHAACAIIRALRERDRSAFEDAVRGGEPLFNAAHAYARLDPAARPAPEACALAELLRLSEGRVPTATLDVLLHTVVSLSCAPLLRAAVGCSADVARRVRATRDALLVRAMMPSTACPEHSAALAAALVTEYGARFSRRLVIGRTVRAGAAVTQLEQELATGKAGDRMRRLADAMVLMHATQDPHLCGAVAGCPALRGLYAMCVASYRALTAPPEAQLVALDALPIEGCEELKTLLSAVHDRKGPFDARVYDVLLLRCCGPDAGANASMRHAVRSSQLRFELRDERWRQEKGARARIEAILVDLHQQLVRPEEEADVLDDAYILVVHLGYMDGPAGNSCADALHVLRLLLHFGRPHVSATSDAEAERVCVQRSCGLLLRTALPRAAFAVSNVHQTAMKTVIEAEPLLTTLPAARGDVAAVACAAMRKDRINAKASDVVLMFIDLACNRRACGPQAERDEEQRASIVYRLLRVACTCHPAAVMHIVSQHGADPNARVRMPPERDDPVTDLAFAPNPNESFPSTLPRERFCRRMAKCRSRGWCQRSESLLMWALLAGDYDSLTLEVMKALVRAGADPRPDADRMMFVARRFSRDFIYERLQEILSKTKNDG